jgi:hypothetical protein
MAIIKSGKNEKFSTSRPLIKHNPGHKVVACIRSTREAGELLFRHEFIVTNLSENVSPDTIFSIYAKRGTMENFIKEAKAGFYFDKTDSPPLFGESCPNDAQLDSLQLSQLLKNDWL